jgi:dipeptidyl aminopeptidase/acylaminoacyl peptidase
MPYSLPMPAASEWVLSEPPPKANARFAYGEGPQQFGDVWLAPGGMRAPLVLAIHGGFWKARYDLTHLGHACHALAQAGFAVFSIEYRRVGNGGGVPQTLEDLLLAAGSLARLASLQPIDPDRTLVVGHSAGGQLALWIAKEHPFRGVVALAPVTDLARASELKLGGGAADAFVGGPALDRPGEVAEASPIARLPIRARQVLIHGDEDPDVPFAFSEQYVTRARELGDDAQLERLHGMGHFEVIDPKSAAWPSVVGALRTLCLDG